MTVEVKITQDDVETAVREWFMRQKEYELCKDKRIDISWRGGSTHLINPQEEEGTK